MYQERSSGENQNQGEPMMPTLLVVEDEKKLLESLRRGLSDEGYNVLAASTGEEGFYLAMNDDVDAVVLDVMLPGRD